MAVPHSFIYTKTGDGGVSSLYTGEKRTKSDPVFVALGDVDELSAALGLSAHACEEASNGLSELIHDIQCALLEIGSNIATPRSSASTTKATETNFDKDGLKTKTLEDIIDTLDAQLPALTNFILPFGGPSSCFLHQARAVCRRAERSIVALHGVDEDVLAYINRLSDLLFVAARFAAKCEGQQEVCYQKSRGASVRSLEVLRECPHPAGWARLSKGVAVLAAVAVAALGLRKIVST